VAVRADRDVLTNYRFGTHNRSRMNHGCAPIDESSVASAASSEPT
jgi:hypothetical protein